MYEAMRCASIGDSVTTVTKAPNPGIRNRSFFQLSYQLQTEVQDLGNLSSISIRPEAVGARAQADSAQQVPPTRRIKIVTKELSLKEYLRSY